MEKTTEKMGVAYVLNDGFDENAVDQICEVLMGYKYEVRLFESYETMKNALKYAKLVVACDDNAGMRHDLNHLQQSGLVFKYVLYRDEPQKKTLMMARNNGPKKNVVLKKPFVSETFKKSLEEMIQ